MGQKTNPIALRLGIHHDHKSIWYLPKEQYRDALEQDIKIREMIEKKLRTAGVGRVVIERSQNSIKITIFVMRPGIVIGRGGSGLETLKKEIDKVLKVAQNVTQQRIELKVEPIKEPNLNAKLVAENIADQLAKRVPHRRVMKFTIDRVMNSGAKGVRIVLSGRINGAEIGRVEKLSAGKVSLSTVRENIDYAQIPSLTKSGYVGVKVWINK